MTTTAWRLLGATITLAALTRAGRAQEPPCDALSPATHEAAEGCLAQLERAATSGPAGAERSQAAQQAARLQARLAAGDFRPGDRIELRVLGDSVLTGTLTVEPGPTVNLSGIGPLSLKGVLRGDLQTYFTRALGTYLKDPVVQARALLRLAVVGEVKTPGFYSVPASTTLSDLIMEAGGFTRDAKASDLHIDRGATKVWSPTQVQSALAAGATVSAMALHTGDRVVVPRVNRDPAGMVLRIAGLVLAIPAALLGLHAVGVM